MKWMLICGALLGALAVMSGAFGAHALQGVLDERAAGWYDTAVSYHAQHALALLAAGLLVRQTTNRLWARVAGVCFLLGVIIFCGSLYLMAFTHWTKLGMITPIGGLFLIAGWLSLAAAATTLLTPDVT